MEGQHGVEGQLRCICCGAEHQEAGAQGSPRTALQPWHWDVSPSSVLHPQAVPALWGGRGVKGRAWFPPPLVSPLTPCLPLTPAPAYCCNALDGRWYSYDDSRVEGVREAEVSTRSAYILFYQRRNAAPAWAAGSSLRGEHPPPCLPAPHSTHAP